MPVAYRNKTKEGRERKNQTYVVANRFVRRRDQEIALLFERAQGDKIHEIVLELEID